LRQRPAAQVRHLEYRQLLLAAPVVRQDAAATLLRLPGIEQGDAVLTEQASQIVAAIGSDESVIRLQPGRIALRAWPPRIGEVAHPDLAAIEQGVGKAVARQVGKTDDFREAPGCIFGRHFGEQFEGLGIESLDAARSVVLGDDDAAVLRDRAANGIARLQHAPDDSRRQHIDFRQAAVTAEDIGIAAVA